VFNNLLKVSKTLISKCVKPAIELAKKAFQPQINNIKNSSLGKVAAKLLPVVNSPAVKSTVSRIQKALAVPKTVTPVKKEDASTTQTSNKTQVNQPKVYNTSLSTMGKIVNLVDEYNKTEVIKREDIIRGQLQSDAIGYVIDMTLSSPAMPSSIKVLRAMMPQKYKKNYLKLTYELFQIDMKNQFNQFGNDVYNAQIPVISNVIGSFTNSSDYKENGPLPLESVKTNHLIAIMNWAMYSNAAGGYLNHADKLTTINNIMNNTNMSSVIGANAGGALIDGGVGMADSLIELAIDPSEFMKNVYTLIKDSPVIVPALLKKIHDYSDHFVYEAKPQEKARLEGRIAFELFSFVALSAWGKAGEGAKTTQELQKMKALTQAEKEASTITKSGGVVFRTVEEEAVVAGKAVEEGVTNGTGKAGEVIEGAGVGINESTIIPDYYVAPNGKTLPGQYKEWLGENMRDSLMNSVSDPTLKKAIGEVFRPGSIIGDGGTADIIKFEKETGILLSKSGHIQKGIDMSKYFQKLIDSATLSSADAKIAQDILNSFKSVLGGK
jgi:hypothetical protein